MIDPEHFFEPPGMFWPGVALWLTGYFCGVVTAAGALYWYVFRRGR